MIELLLGLGAALLAALGWGMAERGGRKREKQRAERGEKLIAVHIRVRDRDRRIDEAFRDAEGASDEERDDRLRNPNDY